MGGKLPFERNRRLRASGPCRKDAVLSRLPALQGSTLRKRAPEQCRRVGATNSLRCKLPRGQRM